MVAAMSPPLDPLTRFLGAVREHPDRIAVRGTDEEVTFGELDRRTARLADWLSSRGVGPGDRVGVHLKRGAGLITAFLGAWRAGAAYVPLDPEYPPQRLAFMVDDAGVTFLLTESEAEFVPSGVEAVVPSQLVDPHVDSIIARDEVPRGTTAYLIYTSGSTGMPKGVVATREGVAQLMSALEQTGIYEDRRTVVAWNASASFDASVQQWVRVCRGDTVVVLDDEQRRDPDQLATALAENLVTALDVTPSHWEMLRSRLLPPLPDGRRLRLLLGGEPVPERMWRELAEAAAGNGPQAVNLYGPTECTVDSTAGWITGDGPHIGTALPGIELHLLDDALRPVPQGTVGELFIAGPGLAHGYVNQPSLTATSFVPSPFGEPGTRMYRTGDLARWGSSGVLEYVGRGDRQIKHRGFRIELGEIESVLTTHPGVDRAVVVSQEVNASRQVVAYYIPAGAAAPSPERLRKYVAQTLPEYMVPSICVELEKLPLTPNGKLDVGALPKPRNLVSDQEASGSDPEGELEELIAQVFAEVLGRDGISADDDFFALGGHSHMALRVVARLKKNLRLVVPIREVYKHPRVRDLARYVEGLAEAATPLPQHIRGPEGSMDGEKRA
ncbi:non-ribosomal peptide synthetase [Streptomyces scopuliridis]|uniref:Non-ribosomal peptide synthetase n=1 Tax=Streptomyces scopuliridis TaxID=452529 RepID=A0ACD4ZC96_9ACTN|nr:non-ribosomal peptide synthetase [Streptomyces scopuliridis]WSB95773.1 non-ribosomal peptide synthetase [Streptomyces scopuliridis]WSC10520.1 non-ribosomal peptide synthetase [Streptomyces scopuliridis]